MIYYIVLILTLLISPLYAGDQVNNPFDGGTVSGNTTLDDGSGDSPSLTLKDGDDKTLTIIKTDSGPTTIVNNEDDIQIPNKTFNGICNTNDLIAGTQDSRFSFDELALSYDGSNDSSTCTTETEFVTTPFTVYVKFRPNSVPNLSGVDNTLFAKQKTSPTVDVWYLLIEEAVGARNKLGFGVRDSGGTTNTLHGDDQLVPGNTYDVFITLQASGGSSTMNMYVNGVKQTEETTFSDVLDTSNPANLYFSKGSSTFDGKMYNIRFWSKILSESEMAQVIAGENVTSSLVSNWDHSDGSGATLSDIVSSYDMTISGATWTLGATQLTNAVNADASSGYTCLLEQADRANLNRSITTANSDIVLRVYSADATQVNDYLDMYHNQTNARIVSGSGELVLSGVSNSVTIAHESGDTGVLKFGTSADAAIFSQRWDIDKDQFMFAPSDSIGNQIIITNSANSSKDHDHAAQTNPTQYWQDDSDPDISNNKWGAAAHNGSDLEITTGALTGAGSSPATITNNLKLNPTGLVDVATAFAFTPSSTQNIAAATGITAAVHREYSIVRVAGDGGAIDITANPQIAAGIVDGQLLIIQGTHDTNTVKFDDGTGLAMSASVTLGDQDILEFIWDSGDSEWIMRNSDSK